MPHRRNPQPDWDPASWVPFIDDLGAGGATGLDVDALIDDGLLVPTFAGPFVPLPLLLDGIVLTHRLSVAEVAGAYLDLNPDLSPLQGPLWDGLPLADGGVARQATMREASALGLAENRLVAVGPDGWLTGLEPGTLLAVRLEGGVLHMGTPTVGIPLHRRRARALRRTFQSTQRNVVEHGGRLTDGTPLTLTVRELVCTLMLTDGERFRDLEPPLVDQLAAARLHTEHGWVAEVGTDLSRYAPHRACGLPLRELIGADGPDPAAVHRLDRAVGRHRVGLLADDDAEELALLGGLLAQYRMVDVFWLWSEGDPGFPAFLRALLPHVPMEGAASLHLLLARVAEAAGDMLEFLDHTAAALGDLDCVDAIREAAQIAEVRGDARAARRFLLRAAETYPELLWREEQLLEVEQGVALPLSRRAPWLWEKLRHFTLRPVQLLRLADLPENGEDEPLSGFFGGFFTECLLFDLGGLEAFQGLYGPLLPGDERELLERWRGTPWGLWRVDGVDADGTLLLTGLVGGVDARAWLGPHHMGFAPGDAFLGRLLPDGEGAWIGYGTLPLLPEQLDAARGWVRDGLAGAALVSAIDESMVALSP